ncbi:hypothetical protein CDAR_565001 [Caerostris darwini]|uniref:Uncharacterized protein n=1 Tax=Caerostris darwini TaxID=1538125 RepID=A0AAV4UR94_9ARAC|nr:hypothetical protein CDAR_565001 [Caerostris darwini]
MGAGKRCLRIHFVRACYRKLKCAPRFVCSNVTPSPSPTPVVSFRDYEDLWKHVDSGILLVVCVPMEVAIWLAKGDGKEAFDIGEISL